MATEKVVEKATLHMVSGEKYSLPLDSEQMGNFRQDWQQFLSQGDLTHGSYVATVSGREYGVSLRFEAIAFIEFDFPADVEVSRKMREFLSKR